MLRTNKQTDIIGVGNKLSMVLAVVLALTARRTVSLDIIQQAAWPPGAADTVFPCPRARTQLHSFLAGHDS